jgi:DNA-binding MarR family transcriptional regulator
VQMRARDMKRTNQPRLALLGTLIGYRIRRAAGRMMADLRATLAPYGMRPVLFAIMELIHSEPGIIQMSVGTELGIQRANLVPLINDLESRGLIERRVAPHDRRAMALSLTRAGEELHEQLTRLILEHERRTVGDLTVEERTLLLDLLDQVATEKPE